MTHDRFYYILFYPHIIILIKTKNDNFMYQSYTHNRDCVSNRSCSYICPMVYIWIMGYHPSLLSVEYRKPSLISFFSCRVQRCQPVTVPARSRTTHMLNRAGVLLVGDGGGHSRRRDTAASHITSRDHLHA